MPRRIARLLLAGIVLLLTTATTAPVRGQTFVAGMAERQDAIARLPLQHLTPQAAAGVRGIVDSPTLYRRLPTQAIDCDPQMFIFLVRHPEILVGIWDVMEISKVQTQRIGPYQLAADDHVGTQCTIDLVYGDAHTHLFMAHGRYDGRLTAGPITGQGVFVLHTSYARSATGRVTVTGTLDCFIQLDSLGADLVARTLSGMIGRTADSNFQETARFIAQVSQASERNPGGVEDLAHRIPGVQQPIRVEFARLAKDIASRAPVGQAALPATDLLQLK